MTKEEKLELINKLNTQIDGAETYIRQLKSGEVDKLKNWLTIAESTVNNLRKEIHYYEERVKKRG